MKKLILIILVILLPVSRVLAQTGDIIYKDFDPDSLVELKDYNLYLQQRLLIDIDDDGRADLFVYQISNSGGWWFFVEGFSDWEFVSYHNDDSIPPLNEIDAWCTNLNWLPYYYQGQDVLDERFAARHRVENNCYYGWFRIYLLMNGTDWPWVALDNKAYCTIPDYPLRWGQTEILGIDDNDDKAFATLYPNPASTTITIIGENLKRIEITNMLGQHMATYQSEGSQTTIDISALPTGIYFVGITDESGKRCVQKVVKE